MGVAERIRVYRQIEERRGAPLIAYVTSTRPNLQAMIAGDAVREMMDQVSAIPADQKNLDILLHSTGGDPLTAWKLMSILRPRFDRIVILVPSMAFSAATMMALGADEIVMHPFASLGPIDPQITITLADGKQRAFAYEDVGAFLRFLGEEVGISEQAYISTIVEKLFSVVDPLHVGAAKRASELSTSIGERLLQTHMQGEQRAQARVIAENLNKSFFAHGDAVSRSRARELGLRVAPDDPETEKLMWEAFVAIEEYLRFREPFQPVHEIMAVPGASAMLGPIAPPQIAPGTDQATASAIIGSYCNAVLQRSLNPPSVELTTIHALFESTRCASEFRNVFRIWAFRAQNGQLQIGVDPAQDQKWHKICTNNPEAGEATG
jgi:hypothetical protein